MASLQTTIAYDGDSSLVPGEGVTLEVKVERFGHLVSETDAMSVLERTPLNEGGTSVWHDLRSNAYHIDIPEDVVLGPDEEALTAFQTFFERASTRGDILDLLSRQVDVRFLLQSGEVIGTSTFTGVLLPKVTISGPPELVPTRLVERARRPLLLLNLESLTALQAAVSEQGTSISSAALLNLLSRLTDVTRSGPEPHSLTARERRSVISYLEGEGVEQPDLALTFATRALTQVYDFPLLVPTLQAVGIAGHLRLDAPSGTQITAHDFMRYCVVAEYVRTPGGRPVVLRHEFAPPLAVSNDAVAFNLTSTESVLESSVGGPIKVRVVGIEGAVAWQSEFRADDPELADLAITVPLQRPVILDTVGFPARRNKRLRGQVLDLTKKCAVRNITVVVQAREANESTWEIVGAATTDAAGNFSMPYPFGMYIAAQALTTLTPAAPVDLRVHPGDTDETIADDFLYLAVTGVDCPHDPDADCGCDQRHGVSRLPDQSDLIDSDEYTQDIGGSCVNLSNPNRTLSEFNYQAIVRTSDPDVADFRIRRSTIAQAADPENPIVEYLVSAATETRTRTAIDLQNRVDWTGFESSSMATLPQAVTVATGHILHYKATFKADGYSLGDLAYSLPLAPGQKKEIVVFDASHTLTGAEAQVVSQGERLAASLSNERLIATQIGGSLSESLRGSSSATTSGVSAGLGVGAIIGPVGAVLGVSGGVSNASSTAAQDSSRGLSQTFSELLRQSIMQNAESYRQLNTSVVTTVQEGQRYGVTSEVVANHNHCHALTIMYFEVLRHFAIFQELSAAEECVFVPLHMTSFTRDNIYKWRDVLSRHLLPLPSDTYLQLGVGDRARPGQHPLLKGFDANDRIRSAYAHVDFPAGSYDQEPIDLVRGEITLRVNLPRPRTRYDRILSLPVVSKTVTTTSGVDLAGTAKRAVADSVLAGATGGLSMLFTGPPGSNIEYQTEQQEVLVKKAVFDAFMKLDANYQTVSPARCIRVTNFTPESISIFGITLPVEGASFFHEGVVDEALWTAYAKLLGYTDVIAMLNYYFRGRLIAEWDTIFYNDIAPLVFERILSAITMSDISCDFEGDAKYRGGERRIRLNVIGTTNKSRRDLPLRLKLECGSADATTIKDSVTLRVETVRLQYATAHFNGTLFSGTLNDDLLDGSELYIPVRADEKRDPRMEDRHLVDKLVEHLNTNLEHYNKAIWAELDPDRRYLLLDRFSIRVFDQDGTPLPARSLASVVKNDLVAIAGNSLIFPVAPGYKVTQSYLVEADETSTAADLLLKHYRPLTPAPPYRISVPSKGVFAEALQGACNACERIETERLQDWTRYPIDEPTPIAPITTPVPTITDWRAAYAELSPPIVNIQNAPALPGPGAGLTDASQLLGKSDIFGDITGLDANQQNAMKTYLSNQENARAFAEMARGMAMQAHNTRNSAKIMDQLTAARNSGALSQEQYGKLVGEHLQQQIDGGRTKTEGSAAASGVRPSLTQAAVEAASRGQSVTAQRVDREGGAEAVSIQGANRQLLAEAGGTVPRLRQTKKKDCWAVCATVLMSWRRQSSMEVSDVLALAGQRYLDLYNADTGLPASEKDAFVGSLAMVAEPPASHSVAQYVEWLQRFGPLWVTTDAAGDAGFSPHGRILIRITGTGAPDGTDFTVFDPDPSTGGERSVSFTEFVRLFEQVARETTSRTLFTQVVHLRAERAPGEGSGRSDTRDFPGLDPTLPMPGERSCCTLFPGGVLGIRRTRYLGPEQIGQHRYGQSGLSPADPVGQVYTKKGGFIDLGHVRDLADMARFVASRAYASQFAGGLITLRPEGGERRIEFTATSNDVLDADRAGLIGVRVAYQLAVWHEVVTWFTKIRYSSFSPEDNYSNLVGAWIGGSAAVRPESQFNESVDAILAEVLDDLEAQPGTIAAEAIEQISGLWFDPDNSVTGPLIGTGGDPLWRRHVEPLPSVRPWLVTDLHGKSFTYDGKTRTIAFDLGTPPPQATTFIVPRWAANGEELSDYYTLRIDVDTEAVATGVLPIGRSDITGDDLEVIVENVRKDIVARRSNGDKPFD